MIYLIATEDLKYVKIGFTDGDIKFRLLPKKYSIF